jgi:hypothetical protein
MGKANSNAKNFIRLAPSGCRSKPPRLEPGGTLRTLAPHLLDERPALLCEPIRALICAPLGRGLKVMWVVRRQSLIRFPPRARGDHATAVTATAAPAPAL